MLCIDKVRAHPTTSGYTDFERPEYLKQFYEFSRSYINSYCGIMLINTNYFQPVPHYLFIYSCNAKKGEMLKVGNLQMLKYSPSKV